MTSSPSGGMIGVMKGLIHSTLLGSRGQSALGTSRDLEAEGERGNKKEEMGMAGGRLGR